MTFWKILGVGILIPAVTPLLVTLYLKWAPGTMVGSVDGWLGYLGGYAGGFLAFISAYFIFNRDQNIRDKTVLNIRTTPTAEEDVLSAKYHAYYVGGNPENVSLEINTGRVAGVEDYPVIKSKIKNICQNYSSSINLHIKNGCRNIGPLMYIDGGDLFSKFDSMSELESKESFEFVLHIDPHIWGESKYLDCMLSSSNLQGDINKQNVRLHKGSTGGLTFESKT